MDAQRRQEVASELELIGGLLLGAALVSLSLLLAPEGAWQPVAALVVASLALLAAQRLERRRAGAGDTALAAGLVAAASVPFYGVTHPFLGACAAALALAATLLLAGRSAVSLAAVAAFALALHHASGVDLMGAAHDGGAWLLVLGGLAYLGILAIHRRARWGGAALALHAPLLTIAVFPALDTLGVQDAGQAAAVVGAQLAALLALGVLLDARPMVGVVGAMLAVCAVVFAFLALGPALAALVLLAAGGVLVWKARAVRGYFAAAAPMQGA